MSGPTQTLLLQSQKMLASTVQFSTYDQTPPTCPRRTRHTHRRHSGTRTRWPCQRSQHPVPRVARSLRTQQRAYGPTLTCHRVPCPEGPY
jgi:hypothetical protein